MTRKEEIEQKKNQVAIKQIEVNIEQQEVRKLELLEELDRVESAIAMKQAQIKQLQDRMGKP